jgi:hypothetical protein
MGRFVVIEKSIKVLASNVIEVKGSVWWKRRDLGIPCGRVHSKLGPIPPMTHAFGDLISIPTDACDSIL